MHIQWLIHIIWITKSSTHNLRSCMLTFHICHIPLQPFNILLVRKEAPLEFLIHVKSFLFYARWKSTEEKQQFINELCLKYHPSFTFYTQCCFPSKIVSRVSIYAICLNPCLEDSTFWKQFCSNINHNSEEFFGQYQSSCLYHFYLKTLEWYCLEISFLEGNI